MQAPQGNSNDADPREKIWLLHQLLTTDEAGVLENLLLLLLLAPEISKRVDDDTKDEVEHNNDDDEEKKQIVDHPRDEQRLLQIRKKCQFTPRNKAE